MAKPHAHATDVTVAFNGRSYKLTCEPGGEERLIALATYVKEKLDGLLQEHGPVGDDRLLLMTAVTLADELWDCETARQAAEARATTAESALALRTAADAAKPTRAKKPVDGDR